MDQKPNLNNNEEGKIESEEYGPLPSLDYQFFEYMQEGVTVYELMRNESGEIVDLVITYANLAAYRQRKSLKKGLIGKRIIELYGPEAVAIDLKKANEVLSTGRGTKYETYFVPVDKYFSVTAFLPKEDLYITLTTDITRRKKAEEETRIERQKLLGIIEFLPDATFVIDENKKVIAWNKAIEEMTGASEEEMIGKGDYAYSIPFYGERRPILVDLIFLSEEEVESKYTYVKREGKTLFAEVYVSNLFGGRGAFIFVKASPLYDNTGNLVGSIETVRDITEQKKAREKLQDTLKRLEIEKSQLSAIIENAPVGIIIAEAPSGKFLLANKQISEIWHYPSAAKSDEFKKYKGFHPDGRYYKPKEWPLSRSIRNGEVIKDEEIEILRCDDTRGWLSTSSVPVMDDKGNIILGIVIDLDITERKKAEEKTRRALEEIVEAYFELDNDWRFVEANEKVAEIIGKKREELIGNVIWDVIPKIKDEMDYKQYYKAKNENISVHFETKSLSTGEWYEVHAYPSKEGLTVYAHNINELKGAICPPENE
jgi:PAS domain S-box-containing protein